LTSLNGGIVVGWGCSPMAEHLLSVYKALSLEHQKAITMATKAETPKQTNKKTKEKMLGITCDLL
jgi:hypothetical protein